MGTVTILPETTKQPISLIGQMAGVCWGANTTDDAKNYKRGWDCIESNHGRTLEFPDVHMVLDGYSARVIREWYTHIGGMPTRLQASTRYIDYGEFEYITPPSIAKDPAAKTLYDATMEKIRDTIRRLEFANHVNEVAELGFPREDIALLLPLGMTTRVVCKHNLRNLIDMSRQRMCMRAYWEYRELFRDICDALKEYGNSYGDSEWTHIINECFYAKCEPNGICPEKHGCGKYQKREG